MRLKINRIQVWFINFDAFFLFLLLTTFAIFFYFYKAQLGLVRMCAFILQTLSGDRDFGVKLNKAFENHGSLPGNVRIHAFHGTYADYMISVNIIPIY